MRLYDKFVESRNLGLLKLERLKLASQIKDELRALNIAEGLRLTAGGNEQAAWLETSSGECKLFVDVDLPKDGEVARLFVRVHPSRHHARFLGVSSEIEAMVAWAKDELEEPAQLVS